MNLISRQAEKNKEKIDCAHTSPVEEFQAPATAEFNAVESFLFTGSHLFAGPPTYAEARRLDRSLNGTEEWVFCWRSLVDDALQENTNGLLWPMPLCNVDFDWKRQNPKKWALAIELLMIAHHKEQSEQALVHGGDWKSRLRRLVAAYPHSCNREDCQGSQEFV
jgi:hypothetical protein